MYREEGCPDSAGHLLRLSSCTAEGVDSFRCFLPSYQRCYASYSAVRQTAPATANPPWSDAGTACGEGGAGPCLCDQAGAGGARPDAYYAGPIGEGAEGLCDGVVRRERECEPVVAGGAGSL